MWRLFLALVLSLTSLWAHARYSELDSRTSDEILLDTYIFDSNTQVIDGLSIPTTVLSEIQQTSLVAELGEDKYATLKTAYYVVVDGAQEVVGYILAEVLAGPVADEYVLAWVYFNHQGQRLNLEAEIEGLTEDDLYSLPSELFAVTDSAN